MTLSYDEALRDRIRDHLDGHDRRVVTDPAKRHAAVAVVLVDSLAVSYTHLTLPTTPYV